MTSSSTQNVSWAVFGPLPEGFVWSRLNVFFGANSSAAIPNTDDLSVYAGYFREAIRFDALTAVTEFQRNMQRSALARYSLGSQLQDGVAILGDVVDSLGVPLVLDLYRDERSPYLVVVMDAGLTVVGTAVRAIASIVLDRRRNYE